MTDKKFLQETNFADEIEVEKPENWTPEESNRVIRANNERMWQDAHFKDGSY
jgi:hypothetical protein